MKKLGILGLALTTGCLPFSSTRENQPRVRPPQTHPQVELLNQKIVELQGSLMSLMDQHTKLRERVERTLTKLNEDVSKLEVAVGKIIKHLELVGKPEIEKTTQPAGDGQQPKPVPPVTIDNPETAIAEALVRMRSELTVAEQKEIADRLSKIPGLAVRALLEELRSPMVSVNFVRNFTIIAAALEPIVIYEPFKQALSEKAVRGFVAEAIGNSRDPNLAALLLVHARDEDEGFRSQVAEALVKCRQPLGVELLIRQLESANPELRDLAILQLRRLTGGQTFGFRADMEPTVGPNPEAIQRWKEWLATERDRIFQQPP